MPRQEAPKIFVGIDFGTTFSGVAWAISTNPTHIQIATRWPAHQQGNSDKAKAPSSICYGKPSEEPKWGYDVTPDMSPVKWFKLLLIDESDLPLKLQSCQQIRGAREQLFQMNRTPMDATADFLRGLWKHTIPCMTRELGREAISHSKFVISVTLPAIWPVYAQSRMREAITMAGILDERDAGETVLNFINEPEAAALATLNDMASRPDIKEGDHFVVCDAGGGTVDIITYSVIKTNPLVVRESVRGDGELCGAMFLDEEFQRILKRKIGREGWKRLGNEGVEGIMNTQWEQNIKQEFSATRTEFRFHLPFATAENSFVPQEIVYNQSDLVNIYKPTLEKIEGLVTRQLIEVKQKYKKRPKYIILVGGLGMSRYLYDHLDKAFGGRVEILQGSGDRPWTSICRGAVINGIKRRGNGNATSVIDSRVSRKSFGTVMNIIPWDATEHDEKDKSFCPVNQEFLAVDQVEWFLRIDERIVQEKPICHAFWKDLDQPEDRIVTELVYCEDDDPPSRYTPSVKHLCNIRWAKVPEFATLPKWTNKIGKVFRQVCYDIKMTAEGTSLDFAIYYQGQRMASQNVSIDYDGYNEPPRAQDDSDSFTDDTT